MKLTTQHPRIQWIKFKDTYGEKRCYCVIYSPPISKQRNTTNEHSITMNTLTSNIQEIRRKGYKHFFISGDFNARIPDLTNDTNSNSYGPIFQQFLTENKLRAGIFQVELFTRLVKPISLTAMILISMIFIFGSNRDITLGRKIFLGVAIGLSFELISRLGGAISLSFEFSPFLSSFVPSILAIFIAILILIKKSSN